MTGDLLQFRGGSSTENVSEMDGSCLSFMGHDEHAVAFDESARDNRENDAESGGPAAASKAGISEEAIDEFVTPGAKQFRRVAAQFNPSQNWSSCFANY